MANGKQLSQKGAEEILDIIDSYIDVKEVTEELFKKKPLGYEMKPELEIYKDGFKDGYNKANEWHYVKDGDLPKEDLRPRTLGYYLTASKHKSYKGFVFEVAYSTGVIFTKGGDILDDVIAWKEIVLPKESE